MSGKVKAQNLRKVLEKLADMALDEGETCTIVCDALNEMLDELLENDFFGTEGQLDPRGDHRDET